MTEVTVEGVTRRIVGNIATPTHVGDYFFDHKRHLFRLDGDRLPESYRASNRWEPDVPEFPLYEAIVVEKQPEWRPQFNHYLEGIKKGSPLADCIEWLHNDVAGTLMASRIRIHNVDGSVTEWIKRYEDEYLSESESSRRWAKLSDMQDRIQLAFMRGSKVEVWG